jgi:hypothetical protein
MATEDVTAAWFDDATGQYHLALMDGFTVAGVSGAAQSVLAVTPPSTAQLYWNAAAAGFTVPIDGLHVAP